MSEVLYQWPSVQVDPNEGKVVAPVETVASMIAAAILGGSGDARVTELLAGAPEDSDTIVELITKIGEAVAAETTARTTAGYAMSSAVTTEIGTAVSGLAVAQTYRAITATTTAVAGDYIMADATAGYDIVIPAAGTIGQKIKLIVTGVSTITLSGGFTSAGVTADSEFTLTSNGTAWVQG